MARREKRREARLEEQTAKRDALFCRCAELDARLGSKQEEAERVSSERKSLEKQAFGLRMELQTLLERLEHVRRRVSR